MFEILQRRRSGYLHRSVTPDDAVLRGLTGCRGGELRRYRPQFLGGRIALETDERDAFEAVDGALDACPLLGKRRDGFAGRISGDDPTRERPSVAVGDRQYAVVAIDSDTPRDPLETIPDDGKFVRIDAERRLLDVEVLVLP